MLAPLGRGLRDTLDNLLPFTLASFAWWLSVLLVVTAPAGTVALFTVTDPRRLSDQHAPGRGEVLAIVRREVVRAWGLALAMAIPVLALVTNLRSYVDSDGGVRWLIPIWLVLLLVVVGAGGIATSLFANHGQGIGRALRLGVLIALGRAHAVAPVVVVLWVVVAIGGVLVIPALMFVPALVAVTFNHLTAEALGIRVADPLEPTEERRGEEQREGGGKWSVG